MEQISPESQQRFASSGVATISTMLPNEDTGESCPVTATRYVPVRGGDGRGPVAVETDR